MWKETLTELPLGSLPQLQIHKDVHYQPYKGPGEQTESGQVNVSYGLGLAELPKKTLPHEGGVSGPGKVQYGHRVSNAGMLV